MSKPDFSKTLDKASRLERKLKSGEFGDYRFQGLDTIIYTESNPEARSMAMAIEGHRKAVDTYELGIKANQLIIASCLAIIFFGEGRNQMDIGTPENRYWIRDIKKPDNFKTKGNIELIVGAGIARKINKSHPFRLIKDIGFGGWGQEGTFHIWFTLH